MKYLITFEKGDSVRWLGHLDILRTFERAIRRAELPIAFTSGFNPREKIAFASALSVGVTASAELATIELTDSLPSEELVLRLNDKLPSGIQLTKAEEIPDAGHRDLLNSFVQAELLVICACKEGMALEDAQKSADNLIAQQTLEIERIKEGRKKKVDIRPYIHSITAKDITGDRMTFQMILTVIQEGSAKPNEIIELMANDLEGLVIRRIHRVCLFASG